MSGYHDISDTQVANCILNDRKAIKVVDRYKIPNIAVDENFSRPTKPS